MTNTHSLDLEVSSNQYASIADASQTGLDITGDFTIEAWIRLEQLPSTAGTNFAIVCKQGDSSNNSYYLTINTTDKLNLFYSQDGGLTNYTNIVSTSAVFASGDVGAWVHIAVAVDVSAKTLVFYKNGVSQSADAASPALATSVYNGNGDFAIGGRSIASPDYFFDGLIDEVRVWSDIRTADEISNNRFYNVNTGDNLVGYWKLDNNYTDSSGNGNTLTASGSPVFSTTVQPLGDPGTDQNTHSLDLESTSSQYASITDNASLSITGDMSVEFWTKLETLQGQQFVSKWSTLGNRSYSVSMDSSNKLNIQIYDGANDTQFRSTSAVFTQTGVWYHVAVTIDVSAPSAVMYINGVSVGVDTVTSAATSITDGNADFVIGAWYNGGSINQFLDGIIDEVRIWSDIRTANEITTNFLSQSPTGDNLAGHWKLNNDYTDSSGNGNTLTASGSPVFSTTRIPFYTSSPGGFFYMTI